MAALIEEPDDMLPVFDPDHDPSPDEIMRRARQLLYLALDPRAAPPERAYLQLQALKIALDNYGPAAGLKSDEQAEIKERIVFVEGDVDKVLVERQKKERGPR